MDVNLEGLSLVEEEDGGLVLQLGQSQECTIDFDLCFLGQFLTEREIKTPIMKERLASVW